MRSITLVTNGTAPAKTTSTTRERHDDHRHHDRCGHPRGQRPTPGATAPRCSCPRRSCSPSRGSVRRSTRSPATPAWVSARSAPLPDQGGLAPGACRRALRGPRSGGGRRPSKPRIPAAASPSSRPTSARVMAEDRGLSEAMDQRPGLCRVAAERVEMLRRTGDVLARPRKAGTSARSRRRGHLGADLRPRPRGPVRGRAPHDELGALPRDHARRAARLSRSREPRRAR